MKVLGSVDLTSASPLTGFPSGGSITVKESDGTPSVSSVSELQIEGATVSEVSAGVAKIIVSAQGGSPASSMYIYTTFGGF